MRMAQGKVIVKRLAAIENLGSMDVLCSDKTGTLTRGAIDARRSTSTSRRHGSRGCAALGLRQQRPGERHPEPAGRGHPGPRAPGRRRLHEARRAALRLRAAARQRARRAGRTGAASSPRARRRAILAALHAGRATTATVARSTTTRARRPSGRFEQLSRAGTTCWPSLTSPCDASRIACSADDERDLDPGRLRRLPRSARSVGARDARARSRASGVRVKILTGDSELVTRTICAQVGIPSRALVLGDEIERMSRRRAGRVAERTDVFAACLPPRRTASSGRSSAAGTWSATWATASTTRPRCTRPTSGSRSRTAWTWRKAAADIILLEKSLAALHAASSRGAGASATS